MCGRCGVAAEQYESAMDVLCRHGSTILLRRHNKDPANYGIVPPTDAELEISEDHIVRYRPVHCQARAVKADGSLHGWLVTWLRRTANRARRRFGLPVRYTVASCEPIRVTRIYLLNEE